MQTLAISYHETKPSNVSVISFRYILPEWIRLGR